MSEKNTAKEMEDALGMARQFRGLESDVGDDSTLATPDIPVGYAAIALSSQGNVFAPAFVHARSLKTHDMTQLSLLRADKLPENNIRVIRDIVYQDVDPAKWHLAEVVEFMLKHYFMFFGPVLKDVTWPMSTEDLAYLEAKDPDQAAAYRAGDYVPRVDVEASQLSFRALEHPARSFTISTTNGSSFKFRLPQFGDIVTLRTYLENEFGELTKRFQPIEKALNAAEDVPDADRDAYLDFVSAKIEASANANLALLLEAVDGKPVDDLAAALEVVINDPRFDYSLAQEVKRSADTFAEEFGVDPNVRIKNPVTGETEVRRLSFRLYDILQALHVSRTTSYTVQLDT